MAEAVDRDETEAVASLADVSDDLVLLLATALTDPLRPAAHTSLASTCHGIRAALRSQNAELRELHITVCSLCDKEDLRRAMGAESVSQAIHTLVSADELYFAGQRLVNADCRTLGLISRCGSQMSSLTDLDLNDNMIGDEGLADLATAWEAGSMPNLIRLNLSYNIIGDAGCVSLCEAFARTSFRGLLMELEALTMWRCLIGDRGGLALAHALTCGAMPSLRHLQLDYNACSPECEECIRAATRRRDIMCPPFLR